MINFDLTLSNPFCHRWDTIYCREEVAGNKARCIQLVKDSSIIGFGLRLKFREDHAGLMVSFSLLGHTLYIDQSDTRHWDIKRGTWVVYDGGAQEYEVKDEQENR